jgi:hypothetical protein
MSGSGHKGKIKPHILRRVGEVTTVVDVLRNIADVLPEFEI